MDYCKAYALISEEQHAAGEQLYWDCYYGGLVPRAVALLPTGMPRSKTNKFPDFAEGRMDSQRRYARVRDELNRRHIDRQMGITYWKVAYQVCIEGIAVDALEKWTQWGQGAQARSSSASFLTIYLASTKPCTKSSSVGSGDKPTG